MANETKILHLITGLKTGGAEVVLRDLVDNLDKKVFVSTVVSLTPLGDIGEEMRKRGINVKTFNIKFKYNPFLIFKLFFLLLKQKPDVLHNHLFHAIFFGRIVGKVCRIPVIVSTFHSNKEEGVLREKLLKYTNSFTDVNIAVSFKVAEEITQLGISSKRKLRVIYNGINLNKFVFSDSLDSGELKSQLLSNDEKLIISVGRLHKSKGYSDLIKATDILKRKKVSVSVAILGEGDERGNLEKQIKTVGLEKRIFLLGQKENVSRYLSVGDLFVLPSVWEGFGIAVVEAMAVGLPVVATNVGGVPEIINNKKTGFLVEPKDPKALAERIELVLNLSEEEKNKISDSARQVVEENFSIEKMVNEHKDLYKTLLKR